MHAHQRPFREWYSLWDTTSAYPGESSTCDQTIDPVESSGPRSTSHGRMRSGRGFCGLTSPRSPLQALAIDPGSSDHQKKSIILIAWMESSTKEGRAGWPGVGFVGASSPNSCSFRAKQSWIQHPMSQLLWNHIWFLYGIGTVRNMGGR